MSRPEARRTSEMTTRDLDQLRHLLFTSFTDGFDETDWDHATGGVHFVVWDDGIPVSHASVVARLLVVGDRPLRTGYVEAVATHPSHRSSGHGSAVVRAAGEYVSTEFELGGLSTGRPDFYERLGWRRWEGPTHVRRDGALIRTADDDDSVMVLTVPGSPALDYHSAISCDDRPGDPW